MKIYIDAEYCCHIDAADDRISVEVPVFDGKCREYIDGMRYVPEGHSWTREDGKTFHGQMLSPCKDSRINDAAQRGYEESLAEMQDMQDALNLLGVNANG